MRSPSKGECSNHFLWETCQHNLHILMLRAEFIQHVGDIFRLVVELVRDAQKRVKLV
jgi:hypothetical protein